ncbi:MAG: hypothetical protein IKT32_07520 [Clostridia bacterium]|nr:hypothetical protein [Clostridia bacterium]
MEKDFYFGILLGVLGGAVLTANSVKLRKAVKDGQEQIMDSMNTNEKKSNPKNATAKE